MVVTGKKNGDGSCSYVCQVRLRPHPQASKTFHEKDFASRDDAKAAAQLWGEKLEAQLRNQRLQANLAQVGINGDALPLPAAVRKFFKRKRLDDSTALYRHYDACGTLLYVGISLDIFRRTKNHRHRCWFKDLAFITIQHYSTREAASQAEQQAIKREKPLYNIAMNDSLNPRTVPV